MAFNYLLRNLQKLIYKRVRVLYIDKNSDVFNILQNIRFFVTKNCNIRSINIICWIVVDKQFENVLFDRLNAEIQWE